MRLGIIRLCSQFEFICSNGWKENILSLLHQRGLKKVAILELYVIAKVRSVKKKSW